MGKGNCNGKGKAPMNNEGSQRKQKHCWSKADVELLVQLLVEEATMQLGKTGSVVGLTHKWSNISEKFNGLRVGLPVVDKVRCKNKGDTLKTGWRKWKELAYKKTGLGYEASTKSVTYPPEWIEQQAKENIGIYKLLNSKWPAYLVDEMELIWGQAYANGDLRITPGGEPKQHPKDMSDDEDGDDEDDDEVQLSNGGNCSDHYIPFVHISYSDTQTEGQSMDISNNNSFQRVQANGGSGTHRVNAPYQGTTLDGNTPFFDLTELTAAGAASCLANSFQLSEYAEIVAGSSTGYVPNNMNQEYGNESQTQQVTTTEDNINVPHNPLCTSGGEKPQDWDQLMQTTSNGVPHGQKRRGKLQPKRDVCKGRTKSKGSKGNNTAIVEELQDIKGGLNDKLGNANELLVVVKARTGISNSVISVQDANNRIRRVPGLTTSEIVHALYLLADRSHREVLMTMENDDEVAEWVRLVFNK